MRWANTLRCASAALALVASPASAQDTAAERWAAGDWAGAVAIWSPRDANGDLDAQYNLGQAFRLGRGVPQSLDRAIEYYRAAAAAGHKSSAEQLGLLYYDKPETRRAAVELLRALASEGRRRSAYVIGLEHLSGDILPRDVESARYFLQIAANGRVPMAFSVLAKLPPAEARPAVDLPDDQVSVASVSPSVPGQLGDSSSGGNVEGGVASWVMEDARRETPGADTAPAIAALAGDAQAASALNADPLSPSRGVWRVWFGPFRDQITAAVKFNRIAARAGLRDGFSIVPVDGGMRVEYGFFGAEEAEGFCAELASRKFQCRGTVEAQGRGASGAGVVSSAPETAR